MALTETRRQTLTTTSRLRLALTPAMKQSLQIMAWRNHQITRFIRDLAVDNPFLDVHYPELSSKRAADMPVDFPFSAGMALDRPDISLHAHLMTEIGLLFPVGLSRSVAMALIEHITPAGWLDGDADATAARYGMRGAQYETLLGQLQQIEPVGLFARNLTECLALQLKEQGEIDADMQTLLTHLPVLLDKGLDGLAWATRLSADKVHMLLKQLRHLDPKPGARFLADDGDIYRPDLIVSYKDNAYEVAINASTLPSVTVAADIKTDAGLEPVLKKAKAEAASLQSALLARANLLTTLTGFAVARQSGFMTDGDESLIPLTMTETADHMDCHPSTITRLVKDKLVLTPRGIIPLAHFFSTAISAKDTPHVASRAVTATLVALIVAEDTSAPLSDARIADAIADRHGVRLTARAIAKHRAKHHIAKASDRRIK
mgnify:FL=1